MDAHDLATLVVDVCAMHGHHVQVNASKADAGAFQLALGRDRGGMLTLLRRPLPFEGGRTSVMTLPADAEPAGVRATLSLWAMGELRLIAMQRNAAAGGGSWLPPDVTMLVDEVSFDLVEAELPGISQAIRAADWRPCDRGLEAAIEPGDDVHVHIVRQAHHMRIVHARLPGGSEVSGDADPMVLRLRPDRMPPDTAVAALVGRRLCDLVDTAPSFRRARIVSAVADGGVLTIAYSAPMRTFKPYPPQTRKAA